MFLVYFSLTPMSASLKCVGIFLIQGQRSILRSNMIFQQVKLGASVIPHFYVILTLLSIFEFILIIQSHFQSQKVNFKVK